MSAAKKLVRKQMKLVLSGMTAEARSMKSSDICKQLIASESYQKCSRIAVYLSMPEEVETKVLLADLFKNGKTCYIPRYDVSSRNMDMIKLDSEAAIESLPLTKWNIRQHAEDSQAENALDAGGLDLIVVPGLAFTLTGKRLGRGKGYYDTYLTRHVTQLGKCPLTVGLAFSEQVLPDLPVDQHDYIINTVLTDSTPV